MLPITMYQFSSTRTPTPTPTVTPTPQSHILWLYLHSDYTLREQPQASVSDIPIRPAWPSRSWTYTLTGDITSNRYAFDVTLYNILPYWPYFSAYSIDFMLNRQGTSIPLAHYETGLILTQARISGTLTGVDPDALPGDVLVFKISYRVGAYGGAYIGGSTNARIGIAD